VQEINWTCIGTCQIEKWITGINWLAVLTLLIGGFAAYIARQQWKTAAYKVKLDLYAQRIRVFDEFRKLLGLIYTTGIDDPQLFEFLSKTSEAVFLFGPEIGEYRDEVYRRSQSFIGANHMMRAIGQASPEVRTRIYQTQRTESKWAENEVPKLEARFKKYLDLSKL
jgi:hypothetical protein